VLADALSVDGAVQQWRAMYRGPAGARSASSPPRSKTLPGMHTSNFAACYISFPRTPVEEHVEAHVAVEET
jgi:hypothetical protein